MKQEKSCGAVIFYEENAIIYYLLIQYQLNHNYWGFVKGHVEGSETEKETAVREIKEEVGLSDLSFIEKFRFVHSYKSNPTTNKQVVFFLAESLTNTVLLSPSEVKDSVWLPFEGSMKRLSYNNDRELLTIANETLLQNIQI
jgi:tRNA nucleotidyltransferase (CCA-adding enzyme)